MMVGKNNAIHIKSGKATFKIIANVSLYQLILKLGFLFLFYILEVDCLLYGILDSQKASRLIYGPCIKRVEYYLWQVNQ